MTLIDQIKADREAGTPGDFCKVRDHEWSLETEGENAYYVIGPDNRPLAIVAVEQAFGMDDVNDADMRRFCRLPQLESIALAAEILLNSIEIGFDEHGGWVPNEAIEALREACK